MPKHYIKQESLKLLKTIIWDLKFAIRYNIVTVAVVITALYTIIIKLVPGADIPEVVASLIFSDPTMLGFIFTGAMVLFEKDANTLQALAITPVKPWQYLWSKAVSLTLIALFCSFGITIIARGINANFLWLSLSVTLSSFLFIFIGFIGVSRVKTFNQYIILIPLFMLPTVLPLADFYGLYHTSLFYLIPTQGSLLLFKAAFKTATCFEIVYSLVILTLSVTVAYILAEKHYTKFIIGKTRK
ncbi:MAG: ABC transporter permease [Bacteroidales bacterium]|nr:ABC transporter permease [Bacteroidales bacterium]